MTAENETLAITKESLSKVINYLQKRPYEEVYLIISELLSQSIPTKNKEEIGETKDAN